MADTLWLAEEHDNLRQSIDMLLDANGMVALTVCNHAKLIKEGDNTAIRIQPAFFIVDCCRDIETDEDLTSSAKKFISEMFSSDKFIIRKHAIPKDLGRNVAMYTFHK